MKSALKATIVWVAAAVFSQVCQAPDAGAAAPNPSSKSYTQSQYTFRAGKLIGTEAKDPNGKNLGDVKDFTLNPQTGEMFALIDIGGGHWAVVPWQLVKINTDSKGNIFVTVNTQRSVLQGAPTVTKDQWNRLQDPSYTQRVYLYFHLQPSGVGAPGSLSEEQQGKEQSGSDPAQQQKEQQNQQHPEQQGGAAQSQNTNQENQPLP